MGRISFRLPLDSPTLRSKHRRTRSACPLLHPAMTAKAISRCRNGRRSNKCSLNNPSVNSKGSLPGSCLGCSCHRSHHSNSSKRRSGFSSSSNNSSSSSRRLPKPQVHSNNSYFSLMHQDRRHQQRKRQSRGRLWILNRSRYPSKRSRFGHISGRCT